jgi:hypothetical protein
LGENIAVFDSYYCNLLQKMNIIYLRHVR